MLKPVFWVNTCSSTSHQEEEHFTKRTCVCWCGKEWGAVCSMYNRMLRVCQCFVRWIQRSCTGKGRTGNIKGPKEQKNEWTESVFPFLSQEVYVHIHVHTFQCCILSSFAPVRRVNDDVRRKPLDSQTARWYVFCPTDEKWLGSTGNYSGCQPTNKDPTAPEGHPSMTTVSNKYWINDTTSFVYVSIACDQMSAEWIFERSLENGLGLG